MARNAGAWLLGVITLLPSTIAIAWTAGIWIEILFLSGSPVGRNLTVGRWLAFLGFGAVLCVIYVVHALRNPAITGESRWVWPVLLVVGNGFAQPVYWWLWIRPNGWGEQRRDPLKAGSDAASRG